MGITLTTNNKSLTESYDRRLSAAKRVIYMSKGLGSTQVPVPPKSLSKIYWSVAVPKMLYGMEVIPINDHCMERLENGHRQNAKLIQGLPSNTHTPAPLATVGWVSVQGYVALMTIMFIVRTMCLPDTSLFRKIMTLRVQMILNNQICENESVMGPVKSALCYARKYGLGNIF